MWLNAIEENNNTKNLILNSINPEIKIQKYGYLGKLPDEIFYVTDKSVMRDSAGEEGMSS